MGDKESYGFIGDSALASGYNFVLVEYTLAPEVRMDEIVSEIHEAIDWVIVNIDEYDGDPQRVFISGHSAGGHLTAMGMSDQRVAGGIAISGLFDLEPIRLNYLNQKLGLDEAEMLRNSPMNNIPSEPSPLVVTVGLGELPELIRQSEDYYNAWQCQGHPGQYLPIPERDHFSVLEELAKPDGLILAALDDLAS
jgi:arylformamidase